MGLDIEDHTAEAGKKLVDIVQPIRVALTGRVVSPGIFEVMEILGKDVVINRLKNAVNYIHAKSTN